MGCAFSTLEGIYKRDDSNAVPQLIFVRLYGTNQVTTLINPGDGIYATGDGFASPQGNAWVFDYALDGNPAFPSISGRINCNDDRIIVTTGGNTYILVLE
jgi:hypothetical protein